MILRFWLVSAIKCLIRTQTSVIFGELPNRQERGMLKSSESTAIISNWEGWNKWERFWEPFWERVWCLAFSTLGYTAFTGFLQTLYGANTGGRVWLWCCQANKGSSSITAETLVAGYMDLHLEKGRGQGLRALERRTCEKFACDCPNVKNLILSNIHVLAELWRV